MESCDLQRLQSDGIVDLKASIKATKKLTDEDLTDQLLNDNDSPSSKAFNSICAPQSEKDENANDMVETGRDSTLNFE